MINIRNDIGDVMLGNFLFETRAKNRMFIISSNSTNGAGRGTENARALGRRRRRRRPHNWADIDIFHSNNRIGRLFFTAQPSLCLKPFKSLKASDPKLCQLLF